MNLQPNFQSYFKEIALVYFIAYVPSFCATNGEGSCPVFIFPCNIRKTVHIWSKIKCNLCVFQSEKERWSQAVVQYEKQQTTLCGDVLIASAFVSYMGYFTRQYRLEVLNNAWIPFLLTQKVRPPHFVLF